MKKRIVLTSLLMLIGVSFIYAQKMNNKRISKILTEVADSVGGKTGYWQFRYKKMEMVLITDEKHNRMRIISPITYTKDLEEGTLVEALKANFHSALDVKYAISNDIIWTVFIHPLKELSDDQLKDAIRQVYFGTTTFGSSYSSTNLVFPDK